MKTTFGLLASTLILMSCGDAAGEGGTAKHDTPEAAFAAAAAAIEAHDVGAFFDVLTPESQEMMAAMTLRLAALDQKIASFAPPGADGRPDLVVERMRKLLLKHGIDWKDLGDGPQARSGRRERVRQLAGRLPDARAFVVEAWKILDETGRDLDWADFGRGDGLTGLEIDGDEATASCTTTAGESRIEFRRIDGGWRIHRQ